MQRKPLIKGNLPRLRHFLYQILLWPITLVVVTAIRITTESSWLVLILFFLCWFLSVVYCVQRLHDAGHNGIWVLACLFFAFLLNAVALSFEDNLTVFAIRGIGMIPWIIICILPSKREGNPWIQHPSTLEEKLPEKNHAVRQKGE